MKGFFLLVFLLPCISCDDDFYYGTFPDGFLWGSATSSYQIEGGWDADGKGVSIWDTFCHEGGNVANDDNGDVACDSYNKYLVDVQMLKDLKVDFYRLSLSWARIIPQGVGEVNQAGIDYYNNLIDALLAEGIIPMLTLYHWDLPQALQDKGGWENEELVEDFTYYADVAFREFGDRVKWWLTFNEPWVVAHIGYGIGYFAPGIRSPGEGVYTVGHHILKAHAEAWHLYDGTYREEQGGKVSITLNSDWKEPSSNSTEDILAAERAIQFQLGWWAHPIYVNGDYPEVMKQQIAEKSADQGYEESRLPEFTEEEKARIVGTYDYFGLNHYTTVLISDCYRDSLIPSYTNDQDVCRRIDLDWPSSGSIWLRVVPWGLRKLLNYIKDNYNDPDIVITENGISDRNATLADQHRINYFRAYINEALKAVDLDGVNLIGYTAWSLMDNFEWKEGYVEKFGLYHVDFDDEDRPRTAKDSARAYTQIIEDNGFPE